MLSNHRLPYPRYVGCSLTTKQQVRCYPRVYDMHIKVDTAGYRQSLAGPPQITSADCQENAHQQLVTLSCVIFTRSFLSCASRTFTAFGLIRRCMADNADGETVAILGHSDPPGLCLSRNLIPEKAKRRIANNRHHLSNDEIANPPRVIDAHYLANCASQLPFGSARTYLHILLFRFN